MSNKVATVKTIRATVQPSTKATVKSVKPAAKSAKSSTKTPVAPTFKGHTLAMYNLISKAGVKGITHNQVQKFRDDNALSGAYLILFRLRRIGLATKAFTIEVIGEGRRQDRTYRLVKGVTKGTSAAWPKAFPARTAKVTEKPAKKTSKPAAKAASKPAPKATKKVGPIAAGLAKAAIAALKAKKVAKAKPVATVEADDDVLEG